MTHPALQLDADALWALGPVEAERPTSPPESDLTEREQDSYEAEVRDAAKCGGWWEERLRTSDHARVHIAAAMACAEKGDARGATNFRSQAIDRAVEERMEEFSSAD